MSSLLALHPITRRSLLGGIAATSALVMLHPFAARAAANQAHLRIMETTDIHVHVFPYDYYADKPNDTMGLARTASIIDTIRAEAGNSMLVDNGDFLQGNPLGDYIAYERGMKAGDKHPVINAMNVLGYDCGTLGNHEFNYGLDYMSNTLAGAGFPMSAPTSPRGSWLPIRRTTSCSSSPMSFWKNRSAMAAASPARSRSASSVSCRLRS